MRGLPAVEAALPLGRLGRPLLRVPTDRSQPWGTAVDWPESLTVVLALVILAVLVFTVV
jgi:hypothetical protein